MASTFVDVLGERAAQAAGIGFEYVDRTGTSALDYPDLDRRARTAGATLTEHGLAGQRILVLLPSGLDYVAALLGCLYAGAVAVPLPPLPTAGPLPAARRAVLADAAATAAIVPPGTAADTLADLADLADLTVLSTDDLRAAPPSAWCRPEIGPDTLALLQYPRTSPEPRGVMVSHANLLAGCRQVAGLFGADPGASVVSRLAPYQDLGLTTGVLYPIFTGSPATLLDTAELRADPARWLRLVAERGARISGGPGAAFARCADLPADELAGIDLSTWDVAFTDAAPATMERFAERLAGNGFRRSALFACYWVTEATSLVAGRRAPSVTSFDEDSLAPGRLARPRSPGQPVLDRGRAPDELDIVIVDPLTATRCPDGTAGEIWVSGPNVAVGYLGKPEASERTFCARLRGSTDNYLRTGDLGFVHQGGLHVTDLAAA